MYISGELPKWHTHENEPNNFPFKSNKLDRAFNLFSSSEFNRLPD